AEGLLCIEPGQPLVGGLARDAEVAGGRGPGPAGGADGVDEGGAECGHGVGAPGHDRPPFGSRSSRKAPPMSLHYLLPMSLHPTVAVLAALAVLPPRCRLPAPGPVYCTSHPRTRRS